MSARFLATAAGLLVAAVLVTPSIAEAQRLSLSPTIGVYIPTSELVKAANGEEFKQEIGLAVGGRLGLTLSPRFGIESSVSYVPSNLRFTFEGGRIVAAEGAPADRLREVLDTDDGARYVGEFSLGFNPVITRPMKDTRRSALSRSTARTAASIAGSDGASPPVSRHSSRSARVTASRYLALSSWSNSQSRRSLVACSSVSASPFALSR